ncbi:MAG: intradiol ring-cleavage dioxygenase [Saprospiraceae bacterium]|nr:intradiol ring-cleavage dioxygenase [Saprospiraceae bacterium]
MFKFLRLTVVYLCILPLACAQSDKQADPVLIGTCEGCEAIFEYGNRILSSVDTLPGFAIAKEKLVIDGTVYMPDGKTPADGVILYVYHTNEQGIYENRNGATNWERRHGYLRGWMKTGTDGRYTFYTSMPGIYPNRREPAHIHLTILEPSGKYYWMDSYLFARDPLLKAESESEEVRGGFSGIMEIQHQNEYLRGSRDIILGANIPGYE